MVASKFCSSPFLVYVSVVSSCRSSLLVAVVVASHSWFWSPMVVITGRRGKLLNPFASITLFVNKIGCQCRSDVTAVDVSQCRSDVTAVDVRHLHLLQRQMFEPLY